MSTQSVAISPDDPRLHTPEDEPKFRTAQARALHSFGLERKARRFDNCGQYVRWMEDDDCGEPWRENCSRCGLGCCPQCAHRQVQMLLQRYGPLGHTKLIPETIYFITWQDTRLAAQDIIRELDTTLVNVRRRLDKAPMWAQLGMLGHRATVRILYCGSAESARKLQTAFPGAHIAARPRDEFETALALTLASQLSQDAYERAEFEHIFNGTRKLRVSGISLAELHVYAGQQLLTDNSADCGCHEAHSRVPKCPKCGKAAVRMTWLVHRDVDRDGLSRVRWHPVSHPPPN